MNVSFTGSLASVQGRYARRVSVAAAQPYFGRKDDSRLSHTSDQSAQRKSPHILTRIASGLFLSLAGWYGYDIATSEPVLADETPSQTEQSVPDKADVFCRMPEIPELRLVLDDNVIGQNPSYEPLSFHGAFQYVAWNEEAARFEQVTRYSTAAPTGPLNESSCSIFTERSIRDLGDGQPLENGYFVFQKEGRLVSYTDDLEIDGPTGNLYRHSTGELIYQRDAAAPAG